MQYIVNTAAVIVQRGSVKNECCMFYMYIFCYVMFVNRTRR